jgi:transposase InsO family protein
MLSRRQNNLREPSMNVHKNARLTPFGRERHVKGIIEGVCTPAAASAAAGVSVRTIYKWLARFKKEGRAGLCDRSSRPRKVRCALSPGQRERIAQLRTERRPYREIAKRVRAPLSTVARYAQSIGLNRLELLEPKAPVVRYEHERPGDLVHLDTKRLMRFWRPGHRVTGSRLGQSEGAGHQFLHVAVDDHARVAYGELYRDERGLSTARFLTRLVGYYRRLGIKISRVLTDNGSGYRSKRFRNACRRLGIKHSRTRAYRPQTNGKAERFIQTLLREWAYAQTYANDRERAKAWLPWLHHYNWHRPHSSLDYRPPIRRLGLSMNNLSALHN